MSFYAIKFGSAFGKAKYLGLEKVVIGSLGFLIMLRALSMKLEGSLETLEGFVYVEFARGIDLLVEILFRLEIDG